MDKGNQHIIDKITAELTVSSQKSQQEISEQLKSAVRSALEKIREIFDKSFSDSFYRIDYLNVEIDLREAELHRLDQIVEKAIVDKIMRANVQTTGPVADQSFVSFEEVPEEKRMQELVAYFMRTGRFPWWAAKEPFSAMEEWMSQISKQQWQELIKPLIDRDARFLNRLVVQFTEQTVRRLIELSSKKSLTGQILRLVDEVKQFIGNLELAFGRSLQIKTRLYEVALLELIQKTQERRLLISLIREALYVVSETERKNVSASWGKWLRDSTDKEKVYWLELSKEALQELSGKYPPKNRQTGKTLQNDNFFGHEDATEYSVINAGLVLLHPFWERLFENLGLVQEGRFFDESTHERAVCLLYHLATGSEDFTEHRLLLPKFICGWPMEQPINRLLPVSDYEKEECESLLLSAIDHWGMLKNTSVASLRSNFLQRRGVLKIETFGWSLYVEQKTQDILLEKLPWSISVVKNLWMDDMLTIHW